MPKPIVALIVKWLVVPAVVGALGYVFVGPQVPRLLGVQPKRIEADAVVSEESASYAEPNVRITAERVRSGTRRTTPSEPPQTRRRRERRAEPKPPPPVQEDPVIDEPPVVQPPPPVDDDPPTGNDDPPNDEG